MNIHTDKTSHNKSRAAANNLSKQQGSNEAGIQRKEESRTGPGGLFQTMANASPRVQQLKAIQAMADEGHVLKQLRSVRTEVNNTSDTAQLAENTEPGTPAAKFAQAPNKTGLPDDLKTGIENLSGFSMNDVKVHYNSDKPGQMKAHAYAQGADIHLASGQERHLPHEAWHVVQQKQNRVKPTMQLKGDVAINDDAGLEHEADVMGAKALSVGSRLPSAEESAMSGHLMGYSPDPAPQSTSQRQVRQFITGSSTPPSLDDVISKGKKSSPETIANQIEEQSGAFSELREQANIEVSKVYDKEKLTYNEKPKTGGGTSGAYFKDGETFFDKEANVQQTVLNVIFETANAAQAGAFKKLEDDYDQDQEAFYNANMTDYLDPGLLGGLSDDYHDAPSKRSLIQEYYEWNSFLLARASMKQIEPKFLEGGNKAREVWEGSFGLLMDCKNFEDYYDLLGKSHRRLVEGALRPRPKDDDKIDMSKFL